MTNLHQKPTNIQEIAARTRAMAATLGIEKFDVVGAATEESTVQVNEGKPQQMRASKRNSVTVRVWNREGLTGIASTNTLDDQGIRTALLLAKETSAYGNAEAKVDFSPEAKDTLAHSTAPRTSGPPEPGMSEMLASLLAAEAQVVAGHPAIRSLPYNALTQKTLERFYINSDGAAREEASSYLSTYLYTRAEQEGRKPRSAGLSEVATSLDGLALPALAGKVIEKTISYLDYKRINSGTYTVAFSGEAFLSLLEAFSNMFNAQNVLDKQSLSSEEDLGKPFASPLLSLNDNALHAANKLPHGFDGEGTPTRDVTILDKGVLRTFLHSAGTAKRMNTRPTGHANMGAKVTVGSHFWNVQRGEAPKAERLLESESSVVLVDEVHSLHAGVNALQGSFSVPFSGWIFENGNRVSIESATVAGDFRALLKAICFVEESAEHTPMGVCPRVWVDGLSITSETDS
ncbi:MAG: TldD/PmbA family protein [Silvanigrellales bacterium]|nr:TldD/PmbA family protein [Silvanigrellales bacterium]